MGRLIVEIGGPDRPEREQEDEAADAAMMRQNPPKILRNSLFFMVPACTPLRERFG